jgi:hypothetical protein
MELHAVGSHVDVAAFGVLINEHVPGADVPAAVGSVASEYREFEQVYRATGHCVFHHRWTRNLFRRNGLSGTDFARRQTHKLQLVLFMRQPKSQRDAPVGSIGKAKHAIPRRITRDLVEKQHGRLRNQLRGGLNQCADLEVPIGSFDLSPLRDLLRALDELPDVIKNLSFHETPPWLENLDAALSAFDFQVLLNLLD